MDIAQYVKTKADASGYGFRSLAPWNQDAIVFVLSYNGKDSIFSVTGLEQVQNDAAQMAQLLDERFAKASLREAA